MNYFPLFDQLQVDKIPKKDLTAANKKVLVNAIKGMNEDGQETVYAIIKYYYVNKDNGQMLDIPYSGELEKHDVGFDLNKLPIELRHILFRFMGRYQKRIEEDNNLAELMSQQSNE